MDVAHHRLMPSYSDRLKRAMAERGVDIPTLAAKIGVSYQAVRKATKGGGMSAENNAKAARFLRVNSDWLALGVWPKQRQGASATTAAEAVQLLRELANQRNPDERRAVAELVRSYLAAEDASEATVGAISALLDAAPEKPDKGKHKAA